VKKSTRIFLVVSSFLFLSDLLFIGINYRSARLQFDASMREQANQQRLAYELALQMELDNLLKIAYLVGEDPEVQEYFRQGKAAVLREGDGGGGPEAAEWRGKLRGHLDNIWTKLRDEFGIRQIHFHIGPGSLSFLRLHMPDKFGDRLDDVRHIIVDTNADGKPRTGFETGRLFADLRGVAPVFATDPAMGERAQVGAVEVGASFDHILKVIDARLNGGAATLLRRDHFESRMWSGQIQTTAGQGAAACGCAVDGYSRPEISDLLKAHGVLPIFGDNPFLLTFVDLGGRIQAVTHIPLFDYHTQNDRETKPVGRILLWRDVSQERALYWSSVWTGVIYGVAGFLFVELLLFWAVRLVTRKLQNEIDAQVLELREQKTEMERLKDRAEAANQAKSRFLANMSHELRTPLNAMLGFAQILRRDKSLDGSHRQAVDTIQRSGDYLLKLINDVLDLAKVEAGKLEIQLGICQTRPLFRGLAELFHARGREKRIDFFLEGIDDLPELIKTDERRLRQVLINLLGNAMKFTERGSVTLRVGYREGTLDLEVRDTGIGISPEQLEGLFQPFQQAGSDSYRAQGTGLGLAITKSLVEEMKGSMVVESALGEGSRFQLRIPVEAMGETHLPATSEPRFGDIVGYRKADGERPLRILVVDDIADNRLVLVRILAPLGFEVIEADGGLSAVEMARAAQPDLVLMDLVMPDINGLEAARRILAAPELASLPVVACSASAFTEDRERSLEAGCADHIPKPVKGAQLLDVIGRLLNLQWVYAVPTAEMEEMPAPAQPMCEAKRTELMALARYGDIVALRKALDNCPQDGNPQLAQLKEAAERFDLKRVRALLEPIG